MVKTRRIVLLALFVAMASVLHVVESWLPPPVPVPGAKLGLTNVVTLAVIVLLGWKDAVKVSLLRVFIGTLFGAGLFGPTFAMSLCGALFSLTAMSYSYHYWQPPFSLIGISIIGAVVHNLVQLIVASYLVQSAALLWYLPYLVLFAVPVGLATGLAAAYFLRKTPRINIA